MRSRVVAHIDMDAFFAAVEQRDRPALRGRPVVIGADPRGGKGRGVVSTCSYEARTFGIHSAMPISTAYRLCPHAVYLPVSMGKYGKVSDDIFAILEDFTPEIEAISIDEAFLDLTGSYHFYKTPRATAMALKKRIKDEVGLTASIGIAPIKMAAKIASDLCKPDGILEVEEGRLQSFLWSLPIERLWGVGPRSKAVLNALGISSVEQLARASRDFLYDHLGEAGLHLHDLANGIDDRAVETDDEIKSVGHEHTFDEDTDDREAIREVILSLSEKVSRRMRRYELKGKTLTLKIRLKGFKTYTRAFSFPERTNHVEVIYGRARDLLDGFYKKGMMVRLVGVRMTNFADPYMQESLFSDPGTERRERVHRAVDAIKDRFGEASIHRGRPAD